MKILSTEQTREADAFTIRQEPVSSINLMERAATQLFKALAKEVNKNTLISVFCGPGNNGGDGLALARKLAEANYPVDVHLLKGRSELSEDASINLERLPHLPWLRFHDLIEDNPLPDILSGSLIVDSLFGSGLSRTLSGYPLRIVKWLNESGCQIVSIDIPSGLFGEDKGPADSLTVIRATKTLTIQSPKLSFFLPENEDYVGEWEAVDIGLDKRFIRNVKTKWNYFDPDEAEKDWLIRHRFAHKGNYGHGLLCAGSEGKVGAAVLGAYAALRSGIGLLTCHVPGVAYTVLQTVVPEAMISIDPDPKCITEYPQDKLYSAIAVGPGIGKGKKQEKFLFDLISHSVVPLVLDADALNILAAKPEWLKKLPVRTVLTPHIGEFKRLFGEDKSQFDRLNRLPDICAELNIIIVLKGANTAVCLPDGQIWFNTSGNPGMATAGSGDTLTGIVLSLLARGVEPGAAALWGVYLHGRAGDLAANRMGYESLTARDIIEQLGNAFSL